MKSVNAEKSQNFSHQQFLNWSPGVGGMKEMTMLLYPILKKSFTAGRKFATATEYAIFRNSPLGNAEKYYEQKGDEYDVVDEVAGADGDNDSDKSTDN